MFNPPVTQNKTEKVFLAHSVSDSYIQCFCYTRGQVMHKTDDDINSHAGWLHSSQNEIPCVFPVLFLRKKLTINSMNKGHIATVLLHTETYKLIF